MPFSNIFRIHIPYHELNSTAIEIALRYTIQPVIAVVFASLQRYLARGRAVVAANSAPGTVPKLVGDRSHAPGFDVDRQALSNRGTCHWQVRRLSSG